MYFVNVGCDPQLLINYIYVFVHLFFHGLVPLQQLTAHAKNDIATRVGVLPTQNACLEAYMFTHKWIQCLPCSTVNQQYVPVKLHCELIRSNWHPSAIGTQKPLSPKFHCHPKSSDTGFRLPTKIECHWNSTESQIRLSFDFKCSTSCTSISIALLSHQFCHTFGTQPNLKLHTLVHCKCKIHVLHVFQALNTENLGNQQTGGILLIQKQWIHGKQIAIESYMVVLCLMCHAQLRMGSHSIVQGIWNSHILP